MKILHIDSSPRLEGSASRELSAHVVNVFNRARACSVVRRDLAKDEVPHLRASSLAQIRNLVPEGREPDMDLTRRLIAELLDADVLVIGAPMYNFTVPTQLKAWIDRVVWAGRTFRYTPQGPQGFCGGKRAYVASTRGGVYSSPDMQAMDHQEAYLRTILGFIGIDDVRVFRAEGIAISAERRTSAMAAAMEDISCTLASIDTAPAQEATERRAD